ncbi:MAG: nucleotide sugar dehydrogenase [Gemmatimonadaceae bacterium]
MTTGLSVFGLGYVGCVSAACFAREGHAVIGVDVSESKVASIKRGEATILETGLGDLVREMVTAGRLRATTDAREAVLSSSISLVCVGTPSHPNGSIDLTYIERVCGDIGRTIGAKAQHHTVVIRSTVMPGTLDTLVLPVIERASGKKHGDGFSVCCNPEFLREGSSIKDFYDPPFTLIGAHDESAAGPVKSLYAGIDAPVHVTAVRVAEMVKYACNCFHGLKVGFANEIGNLCKAVGVDSHEVMRIFCEDTKLNISPRYLRPGFAFGGSCLPKDLRAVVHRSKQVDVDTPVLSALLESNRKQIARATDMVLATGAKRIGVLGMTFKAGTDDLRESPMVTLIENLIGKGLKLSIFDRDVSEASVMGSNREYIEREVPHIWTLVRPTIEQVLNDSDVVVIGNGSREFREVEGKLQDGQVVIDLVRAFGSRTSDRRYQGICW